jgi:hypothetical protein
MKQTIIAGVFVLAGVLGAGAALAQSHSTTNMANPPQGASDTKAGTAATPGQVANGDQANKPNGKWHPPVRKATDDKGKVRNDIGSAQAGNATKEAMQVDPSESQVAPTERQALDVSPGKK